MSSLGPFKRTAPLFQAGAFLITGFPAILTYTPAAGLDYEWVYDASPPSYLPGNAFRTGNIPYTGSFYGTIELESGETLDFDNTPVFGGPFLGNVYQRSAGGLVWTIEDNTTSAIYFISTTTASDGRAEIASDFGIPEDDQTCDRN